jgi:glycosyltransferase involved in cell wall biosynthesis
MLVFADDWGRHPSSCQHLVLQLLGRYRVDWINTVGTRAPRLDLATLRRGAEKLRDWARPARGQGPLDGPLRVANPRMWPWFRSSFDRRLNRALLRSQLASLAESDSGPSVVVTTIPLVADLVGLLPARRWVYYCVDDFGAWPGLDSGPLRAMERRLVDRADVAIAASEVLRDRLRALGRDAHLLTHGIDPDHWRPRPDPRPLPTLDGLPRPLIVFWGVVDRRMDLAFLARLSDDLEGGTILLVGPESDPDPALAAIPRVALHPPLPYERLPDLAREASVLIMPYADLPVTRAMQPLKLKEYLATGRPAVARDLPATRPWADCLELADSPAAFSAAVRLRAATGLPDDQRQARRRLEGESWAAKASAFERLALAP